MQSPFDYEERDLPYGIIFRWTAGLLIGLVLIMGLMYFLFGFPGRVVNADLVLKRSMTQPPLQIRPAVDLKAYKKAQAEHLNSYGWMDRSAGTIRIPVERAMEMVLQRGLPARGEAAPSQK